MIITSPTGLYKSILPTSANPGNITYTISSQDPPRSSIRVVQLPVSAEMEANPVRIFSDEERRAQFGELVFTIAESSRSDPGSNAKLFEVGEVLDFEENPPEEELQIVKAPDFIQIRHDTNLLDLSSTGLSDGEIELLTKKSEAKQAELEKEFITAQSLVKNLETQIRENQKSINETSKTIKAVREVFDIPSGDIFFDNDIYQKLLINLTGLEVEREQLISGYNDTAIELENIARSIIRVSELVR